MKKRCLSVFLVLVMCLSLLPTAALATEPTTTAVTGETSVTMQKGVTFFGSNYVLTPPEGVTFTYIEWSVSGDLPAGITLGVNRADGDGRARAFFTGTPTAITDGAISVTVSAEASDGNNTYTGTLPVSIIVEDSPAHLKLDELIQSADCVVDMETANTEEAVVKWIQNTWLPSLDGYTELVAQLENGWAITVEAVNDQEESVGGFTAAVAGTGADPDGTDGSLTVRFRLDENYNYLESAKTCTIKATEYSVSPDTPATYKVTFYPNGGTSGEMQQQTFAAGETKSLTPNAFTRTGYIFMGWNTQMDGGGTPYSDKESITPTNHLILYARWMELTITASPATLTGNGTIKLTTSLSVNKITCSESKYEHYISGGGKDWTFQMKNNVTTDLTFTIAFGGATASCTVSFVQDPNALILTPSRTSLTGNGVITLTGNKEITSITCSNDTYNTNISGSGQNWQFVMDRNVDINLRFEATAANGETAVCWVSFNQYTPPSSDDDDDYTPPIPTDTEQSENGDTVTTAEPSTVIKKDTATSTITATDGNRLVNELVRNGSDQLVIAPKIGQDVSGVEVSIPATVVKQLAERTDADLQIATGFAEVNIGSDELDGHSGSLVMEAQRTEDGISTKVSIGGVSVLDTSVMLFVSLNNLPEDGKLVVGTLQPGADALNFLPLTETTKPSTRMAMVPEDSIVSMEAAVIGPDGESYTQHERLLIDGKEYYVSGSGDGEPLSLYDKEGNIYSYDGEKAPQEIGQDTGTEYPENEFININGAVYQIHSVQRDTDGNGTLILYLDGKPAGMCQFDQYEEMDSINIYNEDYAPDKVKERQQNSNQLGTVTTGETPIDGLETGKTYNVSVVGSQDISVPGYDEAVLNSIKAETEAEKAAKEEVERLKADMEAKEAALDQMSDSDPNYWYAMTALSDAEAAYEAALAELAALANLQSATVTQTFDIPNELVGRTDVTFAAVHNTNPFPVPGSSIRDDIADFIEEWHKQWEETYGSEIGTVEVSEDGQTLTATYTVSSFSPFTICAFVETEESEVKVIGSPFIDVATSDWCYEAVRYVYDNGMMSGYPGNLFGPNDSITRGQIVTILHRLEGAPVVNYLMTYEDVDQEKYYAEAIRWATSEGIVSGYGNDSFGPDDPITRQQLATILWRYSQHKGYDVSVGENTNILSYEDAFDISEYAIPAMQWACGAGVMGGYGNGYLGPNDGATRAQAAQMLKNFVEKAAK